MLFNNKIDPCCAYCDSGTRISEAQVACLKRGIVSSGGFCKKFKYDPLKREPVCPVSLDKERYSEQDFSLDSE
ncbi:MAG: hypothetical protein ACI3VB_00600 [Oscillospiraceae bacterium]